MASVPHLCGCVTRPTRCIPAVARRGNRVLFLSSSPSAQPKRSNMPSLFLCITKSVCSRGGNAHATALSCSIPVRQLSASLPTSVSSSCTRQDNNRWHPSLIPELHGLPKNNFVDGAKSKGTQISQLKNGIAVASEDVPGAGCCVSVIVGVGSRYESGRFSGVSHFLDRLAFKSTEKYSHADMIEKLRTLGGNFMSSSNRETQLYQGMVFNDDLDSCMELLSEAVLKPNYTEEEVAEQCAIVGWELEEITSKADVFLPELLHRAAYGEHTLGNAQMCEQEQADQLVPALIHEFRQQHFIAPRIVVAGAGVNHEVLVSLAEKYFGDVPTTAPASDDALMPAEVAKYTGGCALYPMKISPANNARGIPLSHLGLGFEGVSFVDEDIYPFAVLQLLLGGGFSFSVGGPGKGMFSRMYNNVMNYNSWVDMALAMNVCYSDSGLFYLQGSAPPHQIQQLLDIFVNELVKIPATLSEMEVARARNQLKAHMLMNLESMSIVAEDISRQVLPFGFRLSAEQLIRKTDAVTVEDIQRVARKMLTSAPTLAAYGDIRKLDHYEQLCEKLADKLAK